MVVVAVVVAVDVVVVEHVVVVTMLMLFADVEVGGDAEEPRREGDELGASAIAEHERGGCAQEGREREERASAGCAEDALCSEVQPQAQAVAGSSASQQP